MHPGHCHPSSSGLLGNLEEKMTKNIDKVTDRLKKKLNPKKGSIFVPSSSAANGSPERPLPRSTSHFEPTSNSLSPNFIDHRRQSAPSPVGRGPALVPPPLLPHQTSMNQGPPPPIGFIAPLSIDTFGGECAGSGYDRWLHEDAKLEEADDRNLSHIQAQKLSLTMVQQKIANVDQILNQVQKDNQALNDFIASTFAAQLANPERLNMKKMDERIESLRSEIDNLRKLSPRSVPPERPPRPNAQIWWGCPLCAEHCPMYEFRCKRCAFPRPEIDPNEVVYCNCAECMRAVAERLFVSVTPEDDWMMMATIDLLVDMGFSKERAERAIELTNGVGVEAAMEWLIAHEGEELPPKAEAPTETPSETPPQASESAPQTGENANAANMNSYKCNDCDKLFRDMDALMFHATKSGHENFSESTEEIKPLTEEEKKQKAEELRLKIKAARAKKDEAEKQEAIEKERRRRDEGKKMLETREKQKEMELRAIADERRREKQEELEARNRVLEQIRLDKEARRARETGQPVSQPAAPLHVAAPTSTVDYDKANIQVRLINGQTVKNQFSANETLAAVRVWLQMNHSDGLPFELLMPYPRKMFTSDDYDAPLKALGLAPSASIVMTR